VKPLSSLTLFADEPTHIGSPPAIRMCRVPAQGRGPAQRRIHGHLWGSTARARGGGVSRVRKLQDDLAYPPRAMKAERAAAYLDMSRSKFLELVEAQRLPKPKIIDGIRVWDRLALDAAFNDFPERSEDDNLGSRRNSFDDVLRGSAWRP
jgi:hypothetical protein